MDQTMDESVSIRVARPEDEAALTELITASYATLDDGRYDSRQLAKALVPMSKANPKLLGSDTYFVAEVNGIAGACGGWSFEKPGTTEIEEGVAHIRHFATHPNYLRRGLARQLIERCLNEARERGVRLIKVQSTLHAERFYASAGFRSVGPIDVTIGPGIMLPAVGMELYF
ncbi:MAG: GNAT family N-acetyltransferase [Rhizobiaceae bacterium]|nr:GNAT family N-acetyltransferase [Rhizobiaceae bacterium]